MNQKIITIAGILFAVIFVVALALVFKNVMDLLIQLINNLHIFKN